MPLTGNLETFKLNSIFQLLNDDQKTGVLKVRNEDKEIRIYIKDGEIIYATGSQKKDRLGQFLKNNDLISQEQLLASLKQAFSSLIYLALSLLQLRPDLVVALFAICCWIVRCFGFGIKRFLLHRLLALLPFL